jgi:NAD(P)-dependent dehydrogenase (short-subunit alcohol dehydrogenase family)
MTPTTPPARRFVGRCAVVTGAGAGVGRATALRLAAEGAAVVVADIAAEAARGTVDLISQAGGEAVDQVTDVSDEESVRAMVARAVETYGRLDILHNNAAALSADVYGRDLGVVELDLQVWNRAMAVNAGGVLLGCKHAVPAMRASGGGSIVSTVSVAAFHGGDDHAAYGSSKATVTALTRYVASMYGRDAIRCNAVAPGLIMSQTARAALSEEQLAEFAIERALPWAAEPEDIAAVVTWLCSEEARGITGQTIVVDSGILSRRPRDVMAAWGEYLAESRS